MSRRNAAPDPWGFFPTMEATPTYAAPTPHEVGRGEALVRYDARQQLALLQEADAAAEHRYRERIRQAERDAIRARIDRVEERISRERPLLRDAALGLAATGAPLGFLVSGSRLEDETRSAAYLAALAVGAIAGVQWMEHRSEVRRVQAEDELDRLRARLAEKSIPAPAPTPRPVHDPYGW